MPSVAKRTKVKKVSGASDDRTMPLKRPGEGLRVLSFFTGAGGLDLGFEQAGFQTVYATDIDRDSCETLKLNLGSHLNSNMTVEQADILKLAPSCLPKNIDLIIGGPPCQSFSASGRRAGGAPGRLDERGTLFEAYCEIIKYAKPKAFVFENVRGILGTNKGADWRAIVSAFGAIGYRISYRLLDALDYGAPQQRERMFLVGHAAETPFLFPEPTYGPDSPLKRAHVTAKQSFKGIAEDENLAKLILEGGKYSHLLPEVPPGQNYLFFTAQRGYPRPIFAYRSRFSDFLYKANPNTPVKTIIASPGKYTGPLHWNNRYFSIKEYMRLQGFPDGYKFSGTRNDIIRQIGNSVSPLIAYQLALAIAQQVFGRPSDVSLMDAAKALSFDSRKGSKARRTRAIHLAVANAKGAGSEKPYFQLESYSGKLETVDAFTKAPTVSATADGTGISMRVDTDLSGKPFAQMILQVRQGGPGKAAKSPSASLTIKAFGESPSTAQAMWNAVDDWVRRSSNFHSLFELYGHFTEPHPMFAVISFKALSKHPIARFAAHAADFRNCSRYYPKTQLVNMFKATLKTENFLTIAEYLRKYRFDIRSKETNIAIPDDLYMVAYPFNLPARRQMNFRVRELEEADVA